MVKKILRIEPYNPENSERIVVGRYGHKLLPTFSLKKNHCSHCSNIATKKAIYDVGGGAQLIEKYCDECIKEKKLR